MKSKYKISRLAGYFSILSTLLLLCGFVYAVMDLYGPSMAGNTVVQPKTEDRGTQASETVNWSVTVLGDSLAKGTGDDTGKGFARRAVEILQNQGHDAVLLNNLGINGLTSEQLVKQLEDQGVRYSLSRAGVIILSIGGNDLFAETGLSQESERLPTQAEMDAAIDHTAVRLKQVIGKIRGINPEATIVYVGLYNPFLDIREMKSLGNYAVYRWNQVAVQTMDEFENMIVIPTFDLFVANAPRYLSNDHFHPSGEGYQVIAERIVQSISTGKAVK